MQVIGITAADAQHAAKLAQFLAMATKMVDALKLAGLPIEGPGVAEREASALWLGRLMSDMARQIDFEAKPKVEATPKTRSKK